MSNTVSADIHAIRNQRPLIHNITNFVVMNSTANALLALGASPIMAHATEELPELLAIANALVINIGTLDKHWIHSIETALTHSKHTMPIVLDPVGAGASTLRTKTALRLLASGKISVLRGNASEIMALGQHTQTTCGVDSQDSSEAAITAAKVLTKQYRCVTVISGAKDYCISDNDISALSGGDPIMTRVTGMGCTASALLGAFLAVNENFHEAAAHAMTCMKNCGSQAAKMAKGPGSFWVSFLDQLSAL